MLRRCTANGFIADGGKSPESLRCRRFVSALSHHRLRPRWSKLRPNITIGGVEGLAERSWPGRCLRIGKVLIGVQDLRARCVMTTFDPDTLAQDHQVLRGIAEQFEGKLALNCYAIQGGENSRRRQRRTAHPRWMRGHPHPPVGRGALRSNTP